MLLRLKGLLLKDRQLGLVYLWGAECSATNMWQTKVHVADMHMLRRLCGVPRRDRARSENIRRNLQITTIEAKMEIIVGDSLGTSVESQKLPVIWIEGLLVILVGGSHSKPQDKRKEWHYYVEWLRTWHWIGPSRRTKLIELTQSRWFCIVVVVQAYISFPITWCISSYQSLVN